MSDRFYTQQLEATGWCPGYRGTKTIAEYETKFGKMAEGNKRSIFESQKPRTLKKRDQ